MTDDERTGDVDIEMDRLLTPGGHLSRFEQDEIAADLLHRVAAESLTGDADEATGGKRWWTRWFPIGVAGTLGASAVAAAIFFALPSPRDTEFTPRGDVLVELRCNQEPSAFFPLGEHLWPRCKGQLDVRVAVAPNSPSSTAADVEADIALVSDDDDLRWALGGPKAPLENSRLAVAVQTLGDEQLLLISVHSVEDASPSARVKAWGDKLAQWKLPATSPNMRIVFEKSIDGGETTP